MSYWELEQDKAIKDFLRDNRNPSKEGLFNLFYENFYILIWKPSLLTKLLKM